MDLVLLANAQGREVKADDESIPKILSAVAETEKARRVDFE
jgi:hypothetical protein